MIRRIVWLTLMTGTAACAAGAGRAERRGATVLYATGADLQTMNPLHTLHPLAKQVQRYVLLMTLARYDSALVPRPYLARGWTWSEDRRALRFTLHRTVRWHDGRRTTAQDVAWTLNAARNTEAGYPRLTDLGGVVFVDAPNDTTVVVRFVEPQAAFPDVLTDLAILPAHLLDTVPLVLLRQAAWNRRPVGNGPFRFVAHEPNRRWVFAANPEFPAELGGPPRLERFIVVVVDEPTTKLAGLTGGELDFAGIQPAHAEFVRRDPRLRIIDFPVLVTYGIVFNLRRPPFDERALRLAVALALDRQEIIDGYLFGFGQVAHGLVPPEAPGYVAPVPARSPPSPEGRGGQGVRTSDGGRGQGVRTTEAAGGQGVRTSDGGRGQGVMTDSVRKLLRGRRVAFELLAVGSGEAPLEQMIQARLSAVGFDVTIRQLEMSAFLDRVYGSRREFVAAVLGVQGDLALGHLGAMGQVASTRIPHDPAAAQRAFAQTLPVVPLYHARGVVAMNRRVQGVRMDLRGDLPTVAEWWTVP